MKTKDAERFTEGEFPIFPQMQAPPLGDGDIGYHPGEFARVVIRDEEDGPCYVYGETAGKIVRFKQKWGGRIVEGISYRFTVSREEAIRLATEYADSLGKPSAL